MTLSSLILIVFVIYPQTLKLIQNQKVQEDLIEKSKFLEAKASILEGLDEEDLAQKVEYTLIAYPIDRDFGNIVGLLQSLTNQNGFSISTLSVSPGSDTPDAVQKYGVKMEILGSGRLLPRFITAIESSVRIMKVANIEVSPVRGGDIINVALEIEVLYAQAPKSFGGPDSPLPQLSSEDEELITKLATFGIPKTSQPVISQPRGKANPFE